MRDKGQQGESALERDGIVLNSEYGDRDTEIHQGEQYKRNV